MGNYFSDGIQDVPFRADEDLSGYQYKLVQPASVEQYVQKYDNEAAGGDGSPAPIGILTNDPCNIGDEASVKVIGFTKAIGRVGACNLLEGALLRAGSDGLVETASVSTDSDDIFVGRWFGPRNTTAGASILGNVFLQIVIPSVCSTVFHKGQ